MARFWGFQAKTGGFVGGGFGIEGAAIGMAASAILNSLTSRTHIQTVIRFEACHIDYNMNRPHSAHGWLTPAEFVEAWLHRQAHQLA